MYIYIYLYINLWIKVIWNLADLKALKKQIEDDHQSSAINTAHSSDNNAITPSLGYHSEIAYASPKIDLK